MQQRASVAAKLQGAKPIEFPAGIVPMQATVAQRPFSDPRWLFEPKLDGIRAVAEITNGNVKVISRNGLDVTRHYPALVDDLGKQPEHQLILDGEIVALDHRGRPSFQLLQQRMNLANDADIQRADVDVPIVYYVFDLLYVGGYDLRDTPLEARKSLLERVLKASNLVRLIHYFKGEGEAAYDAAVQHGFEGIVAKELTSHYQAGRRSRFWLKIKATQTEDFVVGGYTQGKGARGESFGALLVGYFDQRGRLVYSGHVGSGFDQQKLTDLLHRLSPLRRNQCPFENKPRLNASATWVRPELVAEVKFAEVTAEGLLRAPVFLRLRPDKSAQEVRRLLTTIPVLTDEQRPIVGQAVQPDAVLSQLRQSKKATALTVEGQEIALSNLDKVMWPPVGAHPPITKRDLLIYLCRMSTYLLPHLRDRPMTLIRYPSGTHGKRFFQKHWAHPLPPFVNTMRLYSVQAGEDQEYILCNNTATLLWLGQLADLELHCTLARISPAPDAYHLSGQFTGSRENVEASLLNYPDFILFDLDPYIYSGQEGKGAEPELNRAAFAKACQVALWLKEILDGLGLSAFVKTSGATGLHIFVPVKRDFDYDFIRATCERIERHLLQGHPHDVTLDWATQKRTGKVFLDFNQNARGKSLAVPYSPRMLPQATVSMPVSWAQLNDVFPTDFTMLNAPEIVEKNGDLWGNILKSKKDLGEALGV